MIVNMMAGSRQWMAREKVRGGRCYELRVPTSELCALLSVVHAIMTILVMWSICNEYIARDEDALVGYVLATGLMVAVLWELDGSRRFL